MDVKEFLKNWAKFDALPDLKQAQKLELFHRWMDLKSGYVKADYYRKVFGKFTLDTTKAVIKEIEKSILAEAPGVTSAIDKIKAELAAEEAKQEAAKAAAEAAKDVDGF